LGKKVRKGGPYFGKKLKSHVKVQAVVRKKKFQEKLSKKKGPKENRVLKRGKKKSPKAKEPSGVEKGGTTTESQKGLERRGVVRNGAPELTIKNWLRGGTLEEGLGGLGGGGGVWGGGWGFGVFFWGVLVLGVLCGGGGWGVWGGLGLGGGLFKGFHSLSDEAGKRGYRKIFKVEGGSFKGYGVPKKIWGGKT